MNWSVHHLAGLSVTKDILATSFKIWKKMVDWGQ